MNCIQKMVVMLFVVATAYELAATFDCYSCTTTDDDCLEPGDNTPTSNCTDHCLTTLTYFDYDITAIIRSCSPVCVEADLILLGAGGKTTCCETDLCNSDTGAGHRDGVVSLVAIITSVAFAVLSV
ncbi:uncharacterized protein LOC100370643 [Saccoglossus kowalevskii]|uniref:Ly-6/neurotoxin-like protein 1-like n=1 Tax=Saccoglossus kowalevskii TaxID=10224 RepID=A0ABM0LXR7_SACKO|nr:PREDICTED: ly-6/neurotoxin-like protein 1-like [Saccoglossus kowalevskii]